MKISGCIVTYNNEATIEKCIRSILEHTRNLDFQLYVSDNKSSDRTVAIVKEHFPEVIVIQNEKNGGFGYGHNQVIDRLDSKVHFVINPDVYLKENTVQLLTEYLREHRDVAMVTPKILNLDGTEQYLPKFCPGIRYVILSKLPGLKKYRRQYTRQEEGLSEPTEVQFCTGCFFGIPTTLFRRLQGFSPDFYMYCEDADLSRRVLKRNYKIIFYPHTSLYHDWHRDNTGSLRGITRFLTSLLKYFRKWGWKW
jgi:hypothetical protein